MKKVLLAAIIVFSCTNLFAQLYRVDNEEKAVHSTLIIEGKVVERTSFWNTAHTMIFTSNKVKVYKIFKGETSNDYIEIVTQGGSVGTESVYASDLLELVNGQEGIFFCFPNPINLKSPITNETLMEVYSSSQGFWQYDTYTDKATDPFNVYNGITSTVYPLLIQLTGQGYTIKDNSYNVNEHKQASANKTTAPDVVSFSPTTVTAGTILDPAKNILTINGTGFGTFTGSACVIFNDANTTPGTNYIVAASNPQLANLVISWSDTEIKIRVPARAGSGLIKVRDNAGNEAWSVSELNVHYGVINTTLSSGGSYAVKEFNLMNINNSGGYTVYYSNSTAGNGVDLDASPAKATFQRALTTWKETVGFNVIEGGTTALQTLTGGISDCVIMYDNTNTGVSPLSAGVLAVCYSYSNSCSMFFEARKPKFDVVIRNNAVSQGSTSFNVGPCPPIANNVNLIDLEAVLLHELGHAINLAHINDGTQGYGNGTTNPGKIMHYAVSNNVRRISPDISAKDGSIYSIQPQNNNYGSCTSLTEMIPLTTFSDIKDECPLTFPTSPTNPGTVVAFDMVHTSSNKLVDPAYTQVKCDGTGANVTNTAFYAIKTDNAGNLQVSINSYTTTPNGLNSCFSVVSGQPATGFRFSLYKVNSCPTAASFPTPVACLTFASNTALPTISGLDANSNYLIFLSAIENTKATFNMVLNGTALPLKLSSFTGNVQPEYNNLNWIADQIVNVNKIAIERSENGIDFNEIGLIEGVAVYNKNGNFKDFKPSITSYYRLKTINNDGSVEYSKTIILKRTEKVLFTLSPNPARNYTEIQIASDVKGKYNLMMYNVNGQLVYNNNITVNSGLNTQRINTSTFAKGIYRIVLVTDQNANVYSNTLIVQ